MDFLVDVGSLQCPLNAFSLLPFSCQHIKTKISVVIVHTLALKSVLKAIHGNFLLIKHFDQSNRSLFTLRMSFIDGGRTFCRTLKINE